jgi:hypothetical protein
MKRYQLFLLAGLFTVTIALAFTKKHQPGIKKLPADKPGFALVELYTSEGCSSCPPADKLLAKIQQEYGNKQVYVLAYHVDYWNRLGWKDVFSSAEYSQRQQTYAGYLKNADGVYTPQAIVNGKTEFVGSDEGKMNTTIQQNLAENTNAILTLNATKISSNNATLQYHIIGSLQNNSLILAVVQKHATTQVKAGENGGRTLSHINIVRQLQSVNIKSDTGNAEISLPGGFNTKDWTIIGFVQNTRNGAIQAVQQVLLNDKEMAVLK